MGFEPGFQAAGGIWEGMDVDKQVIDYIEDNNYGGIMFWSNNNHNEHDGEYTGNNVLELADYADNVFTGIDVDPNE